MAGHGALIHKLPDAGLPVTSLPSSSTSNNCTPGMSSVAQDGFAVVMPAMFEIIMPPVSVCHHVSTMGHFPLPICSLYQCQASSLMGSPTEPNTFKVDKSLPCKGSRPKPIRERMA